VQVAYSHDDTVRSAYARHSAKDWQSFVAFRGRELSPGGKLLALTTSADHNGEFRTGVLEFGYRPLFDAIVAVLDEQLREGVLSRDEVRRMTIPVFGRSERVRRSRCRSRSR
jgi:hypothetical protein